MRSSKSRASSWLPISHVSQRPRHGQRPVAEINRRRPSPRRRVPPWSWTGPRRSQHFDVDVQAARIATSTPSPRTRCTAPPASARCTARREELLEAMPPWQSGGEMIERVRIEETTYAALPFKFEAGTPNIAGAIGIRGGRGLSRRPAPASAPSARGVPPQLCVSASSSRSRACAVGTAPSKGSRGVLPLDGLHPSRCRHPARPAGHRRAHRPPLRHAAHGRLGIPGTVRASFACIIRPSDVDTIRRRRRKRGHSNSVKAARPVEAQVP